MHYGKFYGGLQRDRKRRNKVRPCLAPSPTHFKTKGQLVGSSRGNKVPKTKKAKLKIRALTKQQRAPPPDVDAPPVVDAPPDVEAPPDVDASPDVDAPLAMVPVPTFDAQHYICQPAWAKVFLPTLNHAFFLSEHPFEKVNAPSFVAIVQEAFDATYPNVSYKATARDDIVTTVRPCLKPRTTD